MSNEESYIIDIKNFWSKIDYISDVDSILKVLFQDLNSKKEIITRLNEIGFSVESERQINSDEMRLFSSDLSGISIVANISADKIKDIAGYLKRIKIIGVGNSISTEIIIGSDGRVIQVKSVSLTK